MSAPVWIVIQNILVQTTQIVHVWVDGVSVTIEFFAGDPVVVTFGTVAQAQAWAASLEALLGSTPLV